MIVIIELIKGSYKDFVDEWSIMFDLLVLEVFESVIVMVGGIEVILK